MGSLARQIVDETEQHARAARPGIVEAQDQTRALGRFARAAVSGWRRAHAATSVADDGARSTPIKSSAVMSMPHSRAASRIAR